MNTQIYCNTTLNYARGMDQVAVPVAIRDGRCAQLDFDTTGFTLMQHKSAVENWLDESHVSEVHRREVEALARQFTGCDHALSYPPLIRSPRTAKQHSDYAPIEFVHSDYTDDYRGMIQEDGRPYREFIDPLLTEKALTIEDVRNASRVMMLQFWRNIGDPDPDYPFALCDASTVARDHVDSMVVSEYGGLRLEFKTFYGLEPGNPDDHHWYTFPHMTIDDVIVFRTYDSACADAGRPFWTLHSAFRDPHMAADAPKRESVEMRVLCLFE